MNTQDVISTSNAGNELYNLFRDPSIASVFTHTELPNNRPYTSKRSYINNTQIPITVQERIALPVSLPAMPDNSIPNQFTVRLELFFHGSIREQVKRTLLGMNEDDMPGELKALKQSFMARVKENSIGGVNVFLDYSVGLEELRAYGGSVYLKEIDVVVSVLEPGSVPRHPANVENYFDSLLHDLNRKEYSSSLNIAIVDNDGSIGVKYGRFNKHISKLETIKNSNLPNGVYYSVSGFMLNKFNSKDITEEIPLDKLHEWNIFNSYEEAAAIDIDLHRKSELTKLEHDLQLSKNEAAETRLKHEKEMQEKEAELKRMAIENDRIIEAERVAKAKQDREAEVEMLKVKNHYEVQSYVRKDDSEVLKVLPTIIMGIGAAILAFTKFFK